YRDLFDFLQDGADEERHLLVDGEDITFFESQEMVDVEILARDHEEEVRNHLINYYIDFKESDDVDPKKIRFNFADSEGNNISLQVNR
ncbi:MAG: lactoylglutathione lyase, partial [Lactobacillaceae bacterium]|nr:lactoylglutathione lyase [Lactobacillaceae bacterium]